MKKCFLLCLLLTGTLMSSAQLRVSDNGRYLQNADGTPFFWLGETGWLLPERLNREEADYYLTKCQRAGYNVVQVQTINAVPAYNIYGQSSHPFGYDFKKIDRPGVYGYWDHMDYLIDNAGRRGIYIGLVTIWGGLVNGGLMNVEQAKAYGTFLAERYKAKPNIIWIMGGDTRGDRMTEVWQTLATTIKRIDKNHLMTYHPFGRTSSVTWWHQAEWLDFNMFQSGHRRYDQMKNAGVPEGYAEVAEDNWRYVEEGWSMTPAKPILDGEPSYEGIPQGLKDPREPLWKDCDVRRYAYWSVFAGSFGHTYGNNSLMQMLKPGFLGNYGATEPWYEAIENPGFSQMQHLKKLMLMFPFFERVPDQGIVADENGIRYDRVIATRGTDYLLVYNYTNRTMKLDLTRISGNKKKVWWYSPVDGTFQFVGEYASGVHEFQFNGAYGPGNDHVLVAVDATKDYVKETPTLQHRIPRR